MTDIHADAKELAGNWSKRQGIEEPLCWHAAPDDAMNWTIFYPSSRDSGIREHANYRAIVRRLQRCKDDVRLERHGHWGVGYLNAICVRVFKDAEQTKLTAAFKTLHSIMCALSEYPVLDEGAVGREEFWAQRKAIREFAYLVKPRPPRRWDLRVWELFQSTENHNLYVGDDGVGIPKADMVDALVALRIIHPEYVLKELTTALHNSAADADNYEAAILYSLSYAVRYLYDKQVLPSATWAGPLKILTTCLPEINSAPTTAPDYVEALRRHLYVYGSIASGLRALIKHYKQQGSSAPWGDFVPIDLAADIKAVLRRYQRYPK